MLQNSLRNNYKSYIEGGQECALVDYVDSRKFRVSILRYCYGSKQWRTQVCSFYLSGEKTNRNYNFGNAIELINTL